MEGFLIEFKITNLLILVTPNGFVQAANEAKPNMEPVQG